MQCLHAFASLSGVFSLLSPLNISYLFFCLIPLFLSAPVCCDPRGLSCCLLLCVVWLPCRLPSLLLSLCPHLARPWISPAVFCVSCRVSCCMSVTRQLSGARRCDSVGRCTAYMSPALSPPAYVLPLVVLLSVPCLVLLPAAVCRQVVVIAYTPLYPERRLFGAAFEV